MGLSVRVYDGAAGVGGTWWWNRYPGARVDGPGSPFYCYTFSEELVREWDWAETQPDQPSVLAYLEYVADRLDLRRDIQLETWISDARYDEAGQRWLVETSAGARVSCQFLICAVGTLSAPNTPDIPGIKTFAGECYHTGRWPQDACLLCGQTRRRDRHRLLRGAGDSRDRPRGGTRDGVPAHAAIQHPGP